MRRLTGHSEYISCRSKSVGSGHGDGQPDDTQEEIQEHDEDAKSEYEGVHPCCKKVGLDKGGGLLAP